jgi:hypothetical protein
MGSKTAEQISEKRWKFGEQKWVKIKKMMGWSVQAEARKPRTKNEQHPNRESEWGGEREREK